MGSVQKGIFIYEDGFSDGEDMAVLPNELIISDRISNEGILIRLLCGTLKIGYIIEGNQLFLEMGEKLVKNSRADVPARRPVSQTCINLS